MADKYLLSFAYTISILGKILGTSSSSSKCGFDPNHMAVNHGPRSFGPSTYSSNVYPYAPSEGNDKQIKDKPAEGTNPTEKENTVPDKAKPGGVPSSAKGENDNKNKPTPGDESKTKVPIPKPGGVPSPTKGEKDIPNKPTPGEGSKTPVPIPEKTDGGTTTPDQTTPGVGPNTKSADTTAPGAGTTTPGGGTTAPGGGFPPPGGPLLVEPTRGGPPPKVIPGHTSPFIPGQTSPFIPSPPQTRPAPVTGVIKKKYGIGLQKVSWYTAREYCSIHKLKYATVQSSADQAELEHAMRQSGVDTNVWLAGTDRPYQGLFIWDPTGEIIQYSNWGPGEPQISDYYHCVNLNSIDFKWRNDGCNAELPYACEYMFLEGSV